MIAITLFTLIYQYFNIFCISFCEREMRLNKQHGLYNVDKNYQKYGKKYL